MNYFKVCTALSTRPLVAGWYGAHVACQIPFCFKKSLNSELVNTAIMRNQQFGKTMSCKQGAKVFDSST